MTQIADKIVTAWLAGKPAQRGNTATDGTAIFLFNNQIARRAENGVVYVTTAEMKTYVDEYWLIRCEYPRRVAERLGGPSRKYLQPGDAPQRGPRKGAESFRTRGAARKRLKAVRAAELVAPKGWKFHLVKVTVWELT